MTAVTTLASWGVSHYRQARRRLRAFRLRLTMAAADPLNVVIGAGGTSLADWFHTDREILDITSARDWAVLFAPASIDRLLAEHVFEHLSEEECGVALALSHRYLKTGGLLRIAVPDANRDDPVYQAEVSPPKDGHRHLFGVDGLVTLLSGAGFRTTPLEYFDRHGTFHFTAWDEAASVASSACGPWSPMTSSGSER